VLQVVKVLGVAVTVEVGLLGVNFFVRMLFWVNAGSTGEAIWCRGDGGG
jgi:hypothetical protein